MNESPALPAKKAARLHALTRRVAALERQVSALRRRSDQLASARLAIFVIGFAACIVAPLVGGLPLFGLAFAGWLIGFGVAVSAHRRVDTTATRLAVWAQIKAGHIARIRLDWEHLPPPLELPTIPDHPFELDLDLTGPRSIHRLIDTSVSQEGGARLRDWLLFPTLDADHIRAQQHRVRALAHMTRFRDRLTLSARLASALPSGRISGDALAAWLNHIHLPANLRPMLALLSILAGLNAILFLLHAGNVLPPLWPYTFMVYVLLYATRLRALHVFENALAVEDVLKRLRAIFGFLETYRFGRQAEIEALCGPFRDPAQRPSRYLRQLGRIIPALGLDANPILAIVLNALLPWNMLFAYLLVQARDRIAARLPSWLDAWYELEALCALAAFADLNPEYTFPRIGDIEESAPPGNAVFAGRGIGHPLFPAERKVSNDFAVAQLGNIAIVTGSNMAGKSSFLRALGVNLCLAFAGSAVSAETLETGLFRLFACIRVTDSVTDGFSYFYAEVRRLKALLGALHAECDEQKGNAGDDRNHSEGGRSDHRGGNRSAGAAAHPVPRPLFFLIDEIFRGTNNRERLIGSRAYLKALTGGQGVGLIATHDLELVHLADSIPAIRNYHFREQVIEGRMVFDYRLRSGPCPTTNALIIMRLEGLPVEEGI